MTASDVVFFAIPAFAILVAGAAALIILSTR